MSAPQRLLIEDWLPIEELGIESRRERAAASALPPLYFLHVWWARRPLVASRAAVLASLMPSWSHDLARSRPGSPELQSEKAYHAWFLRLCGILGDPVGAVRLMDAANERGERVKGGYGYPPAYRNRLGQPDLQVLHDLLRHVWGVPPAVLDPTAGGGSIPYEAIRLGLSSTANDLNGVAAAILTASLAVPAAYGPELIPDLKRWGRLLVDRVGERLLPYFPLSGGEQVIAYVFARTVACPRTGRSVPLAPSWWLAKGDHPTAVRLVTEVGGQLLDAPKYEIVRGSELDFDPDKGTVAGGEAISPWDGLAIPGDYIKQEAKSGRLGSDLYAVAIRSAAGRGFRAPSDSDREGLTLAVRDLDGVRQAWLSLGTIPDDVIPLGNDMRPVEYGMATWADMFSPRQLLAQGVFVEEYRRLASEVRGELVGDRADGVLVLLGLMQGKALNWNSFLSSWNVNGEKLRSVFDRHDFAFKWTYAEFDGSRALYPWCLDQLLDAYKGIATLLQPAPTGVLGTPTSVRAPGTPTVIAGNAADLVSVATGSVEAVVHRSAVLQQRDVRGAVGLLLRMGEATRSARYFQRSSLPPSQTRRTRQWPMPLRFADAGRRRKELADADYEAKMSAIFDECRRVLRDDGVLTVMFTHKRAEAWDTLGMGLLQAGFQIETSWPVNTEREQSLHQANKNAAASTIFLVCRKREAAVGAPPFFEDLEGDVRAAVRDAVDRFSSAGLSGVDLMLSTYGPALSVISSHWPVYSSDADPLTGRSRLLRPEEALDAARSEVVRMQRRRLVGTDVQFDAYTDFELIAWETFKAAEFPFDEARRLALATGGLDMDDLARARLVEKKAGTVVLLPPERRLRRGAEDDLPGRAARRNVVPNRDRRGPYGDVRRRDRWAAGSARSHRSRGSRLRSALPRLSPGPGQRHPADADQVGVGAQGSRDSRPTVRCVLPTHRHATDARDRREPRALDVSFRDQAIASLYTPADNRLEGFYIPALKQAVRYDRVTGYYRSSSLVVAAAGVSRFVANSGTMRIIAGTELRGARHQGARAG